MSTFFATLGGIVNLRLLAFVVLLMLAVLGLGYLAAKNKKNRRKKPGQYLTYEAPGRTAAECRDILSHKNMYDIFEYRLEAAPAGGWYLTFTQHLPTEQTLDTLFQLQFDAESPARFSLLFLREAFGMREPVLPESLLDEFFAQKLGAKRVYEQPEG